MPALIGVLLLVTAGLWWRAAMRPTAPPAPTTPMAAEVGALQTQSHARTPTAAELGALQAQSDAACRCARHLGNDPWNAGCWAEFNRSLSRFAHSDTATACMEESVSLVCFGRGDDIAPQPCILKQRAYGGCSEEESRRREARARARHDRGCSD